MFMRKRSSGMLLHVTSLPSNYGIGDLGPTAFRFVELLHKTNQSYWQILPLTPTNIKYGNSPYSAESIFAGNPLLISLEKMVEEGLLPDALISSRNNFPLNRVNYVGVTKMKGDLLKIAYSHFKHNIENYSNDYDAFWRDNSHWLDDYALYIALKEKIGQPWYRWPRPLRDRETGALVAQKKRLADRVELEQFTQFLFFKQWHDLKRYCQNLGINIIGDLPFYVNYDSADIWAHSELFNLDSRKKPRLVSGVPPDYFSKNGQLWGNPVYNWDQLYTTQFEWWMQRIAHSSKLFNMIRLDHFRGLIAYWAVPAGSKTAAKGRWIETPSSDFFNTLFRQFPNLPLIAEDLGVVTAEVTEAMNKYDLPGIKVIQFAFDDSPDNIHLPHNYIGRNVVMTGTHDNNTVKGWFTEDASSETRAALYKYLGRRPTADQVTLDLIRLVLMSVGRLSIIPVQDILSLGAEARMNHPANSSANWEWRVTAEQLDSGALTRFSEVTEISGRAREI
jgi:4-alpha-glucanotransferase